MASLQIFYSLHMKLLKIACLIALFTGFGVASSTAADKPLVVPTKTHTALMVGPNKVTTSSQQSQQKSKQTLVCSAIRGISYGAALVGVQAMTISLPSMATVAGAPVAAVAVGVSAASAAVTIATMIANDKLCV